MNQLLIKILTCLMLCLACSKSETTETSEILGFSILDNLSGHWVGSNDTAFGFFDWFAFDFRPISASHVHSIYEGATNQNIITSVFIADFEGRQQIMARNGGWLGNQYRATYFVLDKDEERQDTAYYRLVDAVGGVDRAFIEFRFISDSIFIDAYKDNSGSLDKPIHHMGFAGSNRNPSYSITATEIFNFPQQVSEVDLVSKFTNLIDPDSALFLEESDDPFPRNEHGHLSELSIDLSRGTEVEDKSLLLFLSKENLVMSSGAINFNNVENSVIRTIDISSTENNYLTTYLHPDEYYITAFADLDNNGFPSPGDYTSISTMKTVAAESLESIDLEISLLLQ